LDTRPTSDRAKENLFNVISGRVRGARFLDLFCGSGAVGIEALSRGAREAVFVESSPAAVKCTQANLAKTKLTAQVLHMTAEKAIRFLSENSNQFDIIFLDPPYDSPLLAQALEQISQAGLIAENGLLIAETDSSNDSHFDDFVKGCASQRIYGRTRFLLYDFNLSG
jgi:16S rRNA (guanine(966)-N(2))-methyltransferase RsmD